MARKPRKLPQILEEDEPERIVSAARREKERLMLLLMLMMGLRVGDVCRLRVEHLDFRRKLLWIRGGKGGLDASLPIPKQLVGPLRGYAGPRKEGPFFISRQGGHYTTRAVQYMMKRLAVAAGIPDAMTRRVRCHGLRHAYCERLLMANIPINDVRDLMRHSNLATTNRYAATRPERLRAAIDTPYE